MKLDYETPGRKPLSLTRFFLLGFALSVIHHGLEVGVVVLIIYVSLWFNVLFVVLGLPFFYPVYVCLVGEYEFVLADLGKGEYVLTALSIANSLFWGFAIAFLFHWLKRRRMRRM